MYGEGTAAIIYVYWPNLWASHVCVSIPISQLIIDEKREGASYVGWSFLLLNAVKLATIVQLIVSHCEERGPRRITAVLNILALLYCSLVLTAIR